MTGFNHATTGAVIAVAVKQPILAVPLAFLSHFLLDMLPHFGVDHAHEEGRKRLKKAVSIDMLLLVLLFIALATLSLWLAIAGAIAAILPDAVWGIKYLQDKRKRRPFTLPQDLFSRFHKRIQWGEHPEGWIIEIAWAALAAYLLYTLI